MFSHSREINSKEARDMEVVDVCVRDSIGNSVVPSMRVADI